MNFIMDLKTIPYWLPKWSGDVVDPSARVLDCYDKEKGE